MNGQPSASIPWDDEVRWILGRPNFMVARLGEKLRKTDATYADTKARAEDEQAVAIHWMLTLYLRHGADWRSEAEKLFK